MSSHDHRMRKVVQGRLTQVKTLETKLSLPRNYAKQRRPVTNQLLTSTLPIQSVTQRVLFKEILAALSLYKPVVLPFGLHAHAALLRLLRRTSATIMCRRWRARSTVAI